MLKRTLLSFLLLFSVATQPMNFSIDLTKYVEKIATKISSLSPQGKIIVGCVVGTGLIVGGLYVRGKKDDKLPFAEKYPDADYAYERPKRHKGEDLPRRKNGDYIDDRGDGWRWDPIKNEWDVQIDPDQNGDGRSHANIGEDGMETHKSKKNCSIERHNERQLESTRRFEDTINKQSPVDSSNNPNASHSMDVVINLEKHIEKPLMKPVTDDCVIQ